jgi:histidine triad (HIT) family protein
VVYSDDSIVVFMDTQPINPGHLLVVPRVHAAGLADLDAETGRHMFELAMRLASAVRSSGLRCEGIDLFLADGEAAGQSVFHAHLHVIPRFRADGFGFHFAPGSHQRQDLATLDVAARAIRRVLGD